MKEFTFIVTPENGKKRRVVIEAENMGEAMDELQAPKGADIDVDSVKPVEGESDDSSDTDSSDSSTSDTSGDSDEVSGGDSGDETGDETDDENDESNDDSEHVDNGEKDDEPERGHWWDGDWDRRKKRRQGGK